MFLGYQTVWEVVDELSVGHRILLLNAGQSRSGQLILLDSSASPDQIHSLGYLQYAKGQSCFYEVYIMNPG